MEAKNGVALFGTSGTENQNVPLTRITHDAGNLLSGIKYHTDHFRRYPFVAL
jgi:hypothetical protein